MNVILNALSPPIIIPEQARDIQVCKVQSRPRASWVNGPLTKYSLAERLATRIWAELIS